VGHHNKWIQNDFDSGRSGGKIVLLVGFIARGECSFLEHDARGAGHDVHETLRTPLVDVNYERRCPIGSSSADR
jgi:hypothetical protein